MQYTSNSAEETKTIAKKIAQAFKDKGGVIGLSGELGAGKTCFTQGFAEGLGIKEKITSPTFTIIKQHSVPNSNKTLYHIDLYRLEKLNIKELGLEELLDESNTIVLIEWVDKLNNLKSTIKIIKISITGEDRRVIDIQN